MKEKILNAEDIIKIKKMESEKIRYEDIAVEMGINVGRVKAICSKSYNT